MKPKKPKHIPKPWQMPAAALKRLILEFSAAKPYFGLPIASQANLEPLRASHAIELMNAIDQKTKALSYARQYLSPTVLDEVEPQLEADLKALKAKFKELLNER
jgi:hypothetical protein